MDDDVIATAGLVARHVAFHAERPAEGEALLGRVTWSPEVEVTRHMHWLEHGGPLFAYDSIDDPDDVDWRLFYTCNVSMKRAFFEPFDVGLPIFEDSEMAYRLTTRGLRLRYDADALGHHLREETPERTERRMREVGEAAALLHAKWPELREDPPPMRAGRAADRTRGDGGVGGRRTPLGRQARLVARGARLPRRLPRRGYEPAVARWDSGSGAPRSTAGGASGAQRTPVSCSRKRASTASVRRPYQTLVRNETLRGLEEVARRDRELDHARVVRHDLGEDLLVEHEAVVVAQERDRAQEVDRERAVAGVVLGVVAPEGARSRSR